jgi:hypothetical protein
MRLLELRLHIITEIVLMYLEHYLNVVQRALSERGPALYFSGASRPDYVTNHNNWDLWNLDFAWSWWEKRTSNQFSNQTAIARTGYWDSPYIFATADDSFGAPTNMLGFFIYTDLGYVSATDAFGGAPGVNTWNHMVATRHGDVLKCYKNAVETYSVAMGGASIDDDSYPLQFGKYVTSYLYGWMDAMTLWRGRGLSAADVQTIYQDSFAMFTPDVKRTQIRVVNIYQVTADVTMALIPSKKTIIFTKGDLSFELSPISFYFTMGCIGDVSVNLTPSTNLKIHKVGTTVLELIPSHNKIIKKIGTVSFSLTPDTKVAELARLIMSLIPNSTLIPDIVADRDFTYEGVPLGVD